MAARIFLGGPAAGHSDTINDEKLDKHPKVVLVYLWEPKFASYRVKCYKQTIPEEKED